jgi:hypothetical protein
LVLTFHFTLCDKALVLGDLVLEVGTAYLDEVLKGRERVRVRDAINLRKYLNVLFEVFDCSAYIPLQLDENPEIMVDVGGLEIFSTDILDKCLKRPVVCRLSFVVFFIFFKVSAMEFTD